MKDFKKLPKMQCGGKVKKYSGADGSYVTADDVLNARKSGQLKPVTMPSPDRSPEGRDIPGIGRVKPVPMPSPDRNSEGRDIPGIGKVRPVSTPQTRGQAMLLKKGGKVKKK